ncbi:MAG: signal recognition particle receptor subunit alpha, partial [Metamycoplasmataceae bacterium]
MGFFKKIKDRLFNLNTDNTNDSKDKETKKPLFGKIKSLVSDNREIDSQKEIDKIAKLQQKLDKKEAKLREKALIKEKKINKYVSGLSKSGNNFSQKIIELQNKHNKIDEAFFEELEEILIMSDISVNLVLTIIDEIKKEVKTENVVNRDLINEIIADKMFVIYANQSIVDTTLKLNNEGLNVLLIVGVNGSGKTTSIAKIANKLILEDKKVLIAAGDTFRAGAVQQLKIWADRVGADI